MRGSFRIAKIFGIPVELHWTFALLFLWIIYIGYGNGDHWRDTLWNILFVISLFVCVVLHEFGHALTARKFGVQTRDIILSPIGGIARLDRLPEKPFQEFLVAAAGPAVNVVIALLLSPYFFISEEGKWFWNEIISGRSIGEGLPFLGGLIFLNIVLAVFNLLPAFPMDGGRILRALLAIRMGRTKATRIASLIGQGIAVLLVIYAITSGSIWTAFIGIFVFLTAGQEYQATKTDALLAAHATVEITRANFTKLSPSNTMFAAASILRQGLERGFLIFDEVTGQLTGSLSENSIVHAIKTNALDAQVEAFMQPDPPRVFAGDSIKETYELLYRSPHDILPVYNIENELIGVTDLAMLNHFLVLQKKL